MLAQAKRSLVLARHVITARQLSPSLLMRRPDKSSDANVASSTATGQTQRKKEKEHRGG